MPIGIGCLAGGHVQVPLILEGGQFYTVLQCLGLLGNGVSNRGLFGQEIRNKSC